MSFLEDLARKQRSNKVTAEAQQVNNSVAAGLGYSDDVGLAASSLRDLYRINPPMSSNFVPTNRQIAAAQQFKEQPTSIYRG